MGKMVWHGLVWRGALAVAAVAMAAPAYGAGQWSDIHVTYEFLSPDFVGGDEDRSFDNVSRYQLGQLGTGLGGITGYYVYYEDLDLDGPVGGTMNVNGYGGGIMLGLVALGVPHYDTIAVVPYGFVGTGQHTLEYDNYITTDGDLVDGTAEGWRIEYGGAVSVIASIGGIGVNATGGYRWVDSGLQVTSVNGQRYSADSQGFFIQAGLSLGF